MKLTKSSLKEMIREVIKEEKQLNEDFGRPIDPDVVKNPMDYASDRRDKGGGVKMNLDKHISVSGVEHKFKRVILGLGLNPKLTPHSCRRGFITYMLEKTNGNVPLVAQLVGHSSWEMVYRYNRERLPKERTTISLGEVIKGD